MAYRVDWSPAALEDVEGIAEYIVRDSSSYAAAVVTRILESTRKLEQFPFAGRIVPEVGQDTIREVFAYSYRIMYRVKADRVTVATVVHGKQQFEADRLAPE